MRRSLSYTGIGEKKEKITRQGYWTTRKSEFYPYGAEVTRCFARMVVVGEGKWTAEQVCARMVVVGSEC
jgi:hypothetical protein